MNPALFTPMTFLFGFLSGFVVRKYWFVVRTALGLKRVKRQSAAEKNTASNTNAKKNDSDDSSQNGIQTDTSDVPNTVSHIYS